MLQNIIKPLLLLLFLLSITACGTNKKAVEEVNDILPKVEDTVLINRLDSLSKQRPEFFYAKFNSKYEDNNSNVSFKTSIRMRLDSAVQAMVTYASIPIYNAMFTPDTVTLLDKRNNCYIKEDMEFLKSTFSVDFKYENLEELFLGLPIAWDNNIEYYQIKDPYNYIISTPKQEQVRSLSSKAKKLSIRYFFRTDKKTLEKTIIESPSDSTAIIINYIDYQTVDNFNIPIEEKIHISTPKNNIYVDLKYAKTSINEPRILYLSIPNKYDKCEE